MRITAESHPALFVALSAKERYKQHGVPPEHFDIHSMWDGKIDGANAKLATMTPEEIDDFVIGEPRAYDSSLEVVSMIILSVFFDEGGKEGNRNQTAAC